MPIHQRIQSDMIAALKARDARRRGVLSFIGSELRRVAVDKRVDGLADEDAVAVLKKGLKQRHESRDAAAQAGRAELVEQADYEIAVLEEYLPQALSEADTRSLALSVVAASGATSVKDMGRVMAEAARQAPSVDKALLSRMVKELLSGKPAGA